MGLAFSIVAGLTGALGSLIPWFTAPSKPLGYSVLLWTGVLVMLFGVAVCARAGHERDRNLDSGKPAGADRRRFSVGLTICIVGGILSCFMNLGFVYGADVTRSAAALGASPTNAPNVLWMIVMGCGFVANAVYCSYLLVSKRSWEKYRIPEAVPYLGWALVMAIVWEGNLIAYATGATKIGALGPSVGWPVVLSLTVITSNVWGALTGEWRGAGRRAVVIMVAGIALLVIAVGILGWATTKA